MATFDYTTWHNLKPCKMSNHNGWWSLIFKIKYIFHLKTHSAMFQNLIDEWKIKSTQHYHWNSKLVALELHNNFSYIIVTELHKLHMYMVSHAKNCIYCNSFDLLNNTHVHRNTLNCNELQIIIVIQ